MTPAALSECSGAEPSALSGSGAGKPSRSAVPRAHLAQGRRHLGVALEPGQPIRVFDEGWRKNLEDHIPVELGVTGPIYLAHATFADLGGDRVGAEAGAGFEGHL